MVAKLLKMQLLVDDEELAFKGPSAACDDQGVKKEGVRRPAWMRALVNSMNTWLNMLPRVGTTAAL